jgi:hypothetical protein
MTYLLESLFLDSIQRHAAQKSHKRATDVARRARGAHAGEPSPTTGILDPCQVGHRACLIM